MTEASYVISYLNARRNNELLVLKDMLIALPVLLTNEPSNAFVATLAMLDNGGLHNDLLRCEPLYHTKPQFALVGTAIDAVLALQPQALELAQMLQAQLGQPVSFTP
tara:strand:+ start:12293 stop:12613 length:321 start_codon:yes stop_codon:yes gene_type:complete